MAKLLGKGGLGKDSARGCSQAVLVAVCERSNPVLMPRHVCDPGDLCPGLGGETSHMPCHMQAK